MDIKKSATVVIKQLIEEWKTRMIGSEDSSADIIAICKERQAYAAKRVNNPSNNPLMLLNTEKQLLPIHCVYLYRDIDGKVFYVGKGLKCRPYDFIERRKASLALKLLSLEFINHNPIEIIKDKMLGKDADKLERELIAKYAPQMNIQHNSQR